MSDFSRILPNNQEVLERDEKWKKLFEKYENCGDCEDDGYDVRDLIACCEAEDEGLEDLLSNEEEAIESSDEELKENNQDLVIYTSKPKTLQDLERIYDTEFIKGLKRAFDKRCTELDGMNLTFWKRAKTQEGFNESNIKTPNFEASTRSFFRSSEQVCQSTKKLQQTSPNAFKMPHPVNLNRDNFQFRAFPHNMDQTSNFETSQRFPLQINDLMNGSQKINIRIREMHYDLSVDGRDITEYFIPNCNSTYKNAIPALENLTINNTISNLDNIQKTEVIRPAIKYDADPVKNEPTEKVTEKVELNQSIVESLNGSVIDNFEAINISNSSREGCTSKGKKTNKLNKHKKKQRKRKHKSKQKDVEPVKNIKEIKSLETIVPISETLELSYSDVVKLPPKNNLKQTKTSKPVKDLKSQVDQQKPKKSNQKKNCQETDKKNYQKIIDPDTSTEEIIKRQELSNKVENSLKNQQNNIVKDTKKLKDKPEISSKAKVTTKSCKSKDKNKNTIEMVKSEKMSINDQKSVEKYEEQKVKQKPTKVNKDKVQRPQKTSTKSPDNAKTKELSTDKTENKSDLQYDNSGVAFRNIGGLIVRYEEKNDDSDSSEDDTEFFRRIHAEIRQKKALSKKE